MNKKFLSAVLFGALMVTSTGTFVSCKDYDDDIKDLQEQIDKKATLADLTTQLSTMESALTAAKSAAESALAKANGNDTEIAALKTKITNLENALVDVDALKAELKQAIADEIENADIPGLKKEVEDQLKVVKELAGGYLTMVTEVDLYYKAGMDDNSAATKLGFSNVTEKDNKFGPKDNQITFTKGTDVSTPTELIVRVVPANAELTPAMISLINGKGESIMDQVKVESVEPYSELLVARSSATGLWKIKFSLPKYNEKAFAGIKSANGGEVLYAVAINDVASTEESEAEHTAISDYAVTLGYVDGKSASELNFAVDGKNVADIHNRFEKTEKGESTSNIEDYIWKAGSATGINEGKTNVLNKKAQKEDGAPSDNRQDEATPNVQVGVPFEVKLLAGKVYGEDDVTIQPRAFYVTLDESHAIESAPSEINAWNSYGIKGLNTLVDKADKLQITIPAESAKGDYIGFRVYAVNYDGTLVDPDGRAFYVYVAGATESSSASVMFKPAKYAADNDTFDSDQQSLSTAKWASATTATLTKIYESGKANEAVTTTGLTLDNFYMIAGNSSEKLAEVAKLADRTELAKYTKVQIKDADMTKLVDGKTYVAEITLTNSNANGSKVEVITVSFTKVLPVFPATVKPVTNAIVNNVLKVYPKEKDADGNAIYDLDNVWNGINKHTAFVELTDEDATVGYVATAREAAPATPAVGDNEPALTVPAKYVNPDNKDIFETKFPMAVTYDYGYVSSTGANTDGDKNDATFITKWGEEFSVVFGNYIYDCTIDWASAASKKLYYAGSNVNNGKDYILLSDLVIKDWYNRPVDLFNCDYIATEEDGAPKVTVTLLTGADFSIENEFYKGELNQAYVIGQDEKGNAIEAAVIELTAIRESAQGADVPTKIKFTIEDKFGYKVSKTFDPFTMTYQK